jgi:hypothetical protein
MRRRSVGWVALAAAVGLGVIAAPAAQRRAADRWWFTPGPGTLDYVRLFERPEEWRRARQVVDVFKFYQQHTHTPAPAIVGPVTYDALRAAAAFATLKKWRIKIAIEAGVVKEHNCAPGSAGIEAATAESLAAIRAVHAAGGEVAYLAMDEPFVSGQLRACGGPALAPTADRVAAYVAGVRAAFPSVEIGLIEAYPFSSVDTIANMLTLLAARNATPAFLHIDVDWRFAGPVAFRRDVARLRDVAASARIPFGVILWGYNGDADVLYASDIGQVTSLTTETFLGWDDMPDHIIVQSWAESRTGLRITPSNLPEDQLYTHTRMLWDVFRRLRGSVGGPTGKAISRR